MCRMAATCVEAEPDGAIGSFHGCKKLEESNARACVCENCPYKLLAVRAMAPIDWVATDRGGRGSNEIPACTAPTACAGEQRTLSKRRTIHHCIWLARERQRERERERDSRVQLRRDVCCVIIDPPRYYSRPTKTTTIVQPTPTADLNIFSGFTHVHAINK